MEHNVSVDPAEECQMTEPDWEFVRGDRLNVAALPHLQRKLIVVGLDEVVLAQRRSVLEQQEKSRDAPKAASGVAGAVAAAQALGAITAVRAVAMGFAAAMPAVVPGLLLTSAAVELFQAFKKAGEEGLDILLISQSEAEQLTFSPGHPHGKVVYVVHPAEPIAYLPVAEFHGKLFEHKVAEMTDLLTALAAISIEIEHLAGWNSVAEASAGVSVPNLGVEVGAEGGKRGKAGRHIVSKMALSPRHAPYVPKDLVWFEHEPMWKSVARARLDAGLQSFEFDMGYTDDFGVNAKLSSKAEKAKLEVGGTFSHHRDTVWRVKVIFADRKALPNETL
jgi:hypothetical protein